MRMTPYEFSRACNIARNRELEESLGLRKLGSDLRNGQVKRSSKLTDRQVSYDSVRRSSRIAGENNGSYGADTIVDSCQHADESQAEIQAASSPMQCPDEPLAETRIAPTSGDDPSQVSQHADESQCPRPDDASNSSELSRPQTPAMPIDRTSWPGWLAEKYDYYVDLKLGDEWNKCLHTWAELERAFEFRSPVSFLLFDDDATFYSSFCSPLVCRQLITRSRLQRGTGTDILLQRVASQQ